MKNFSGLSLLFFFETAPLWSYSGTLPAKFYFLNHNWGYGNQWRLFVAISWVLVTRELCHLIFFKLENKASAEANLVQFVCPETLHVIEGEFLGLLMNWKLSRKYRLLKIFKPFEYFFESIKKIFAIAQIAICSSLRETIWLLYESSTLLSYRSECF